MPRSSNRKSGDTGVSLRNKGRKRGNHLERGLKVGESPGDVACHKKIYLEADPEISKGAPTALPKDRVDLLFNMPRVPVVPNVFWGGGGIRSRKKEEKNLLI